MMIKSITLSLLLLLNVFLSMAYDNNEASFRTFYSDYNTARANNDKAFLTKMYPENYDLLNALPENYTPFTAQTLQSFLSENERPFALRAGEVKEITYVDSFTVLAEIYYAEYGDKYITTEKYIFEEGFFRIYSSQQIINFMEGYNNADHRIIFELKASTSNRDSTHIEISYSAEAYRHVGEILNENISISAPGSLHNSSQELFFVPEASNQTIHLHLKCLRSGGVSFNYVVYKLDKGTGKIDTDKLAKLGHRIAEMHDYSRKYSAVYNEFFDMYQLRMKEGEVMDIEIKME